MEGRPAGYVALLRRNRPFRRLWYGQVTSQLGDWLDTIALYTLLLLRLTGSAAALGGLLVAQMLPPALVGLGAGVVVDRLPRRAVMIAADLGCAAVVLLFLLVRSPEQVWIVYVVSVIKFTLIALFEPARQALLPNLASRDELVAANALSGLTWSVMLMGGAALGGLVAGTLGTSAAFLLDTLSFVLSALWTWSIRVRETHLEGRPPAHPWHDLREGLGYLLQYREVAVYALCKTLWSVGDGAVLLLLPLFGEQVFPLGKGGAMSMGLLYAARGVGAGLGPVLTQRWGGTSVRFLRRALGPAFFLMAAGYGLLSLAPSLPWAMACLTLAHFGGSVQWVFSTALLQLRVPNRLQGRVFAVELTLLTLATALSSEAAGLAVDGGWSPRALARLVAAAFVPLGLLLILLLGRPPEREEAPAGPGG